MLLERCVAGDRVVLQAGAIVGSDGFGYVFIDGHFEKIPQVGIVTLGDDVEVGANTCIDRAQMGTTSIGTGTKIDNLIQIGHNCRIGKHSAFAAMTGLAFGTIFALTRQIWIPMVAHAAYDLAAIAIIYWNIESTIAHLVFK